MIDADKVVLQLLQSGDNNIDRIFFNRQSCPIVTHKIPLRIDVLPVGHIRIRKSQQLLGSMVGQQYARVRGMNHHGGIEIGEQRSIFFFTVVAFLFSSPCVGDIDSRPDDVFDRSVDFGKGRIGPFDQSARTALG